MKSIFKKDAERPESQEITLNELPPIVQQKFEETKSKYSQGSDLGSLAITKTERINSKGSETYKISCDVAKHDTMKAGGGYKGSELIEITAVVSGSELLNYQEENKGWKDK